MRQLARTLVEMAEQGVQIILATHSLFLLREIEIAKARVPARQQVHYVALSIANEVDPIASLNADLEQTDRYMELP